MPSWHLLLFVTVTVCLLPTGVAAVVSAAPFGREQCAAGEAFGIGTCILSLLPFHAAERMNAAALVVAVDFGTYLCVEDISATFTLRLSYTVDHSAVSGVPVPRLKLVLIQTFPFVVLHFVVGSVSEHFFSFRF